MKGQYIYKIWLTSGVLCPIVLFLLLAVTPTYQIPELIGLLCVIYIFPCTLLLSTINIIIQTMLLVKISKQKEFLKYTKIILTGGAIVTTIITMLVVYYIRLFETFDQGFDYITTASFIIAITISIFFYDYRIPKITLSNAQQARNHILRPLWCAH